MIRPITCICMILAAGSGLYLYQQKHRAQLLDRDIAGTMHAAEIARDRTGVLRAEWTLQNDPEHLAALADRFLALKTVAPGQFTSMADLDKRLPAVRTPDTQPGDTEDEDAPVAAVAEPEAKVAIAPTPSSSPRAEAPRKEAVAAPRPPAAPAKLAAIAARPLDRRSPVVATVATAHYGAPEVRSAITPAVATVPHPLAPPPASYAGGYAAGPAPSPSAPVVTSVLGIARTGLAPPVPFQPQTFGNGGG